MANYNEKAKQSFSTRLRFFRFNCAVNDMNFTKENFLKFKMEENEDIITIYTAQYLQWNTNDPLKRISNKLTVQEAYDAMQQHTLTDKDEADWFNEYLEDFKVRYPIDLFVAQSTAKTCEYCKISLDTITKLANIEKIFKKTYQRGYTMEIDRKKPNLEYTKENCVPCCYWCNNAKTDEFDDKEFEPIAKEIRKALENRLINDNR